MSVASFRLRCNHHHVNRTLFSLPWSATRFSQQNAHRESPPFLSAPTKINETTKLIVSLFYPSLIYCLPNCLQKNSFSSSFGLLNPSASGSYLLLQLHLLHPFSSPLPHNQSELLRSLPYLVVSCLVPWHMFILVLDTFPSLTSIYKNHNLPFFFFSFFSPRVGKSLESIYLHILPIFFQIDS